MEIQLLRRGKKHDLAFPRDFLSLVMAQTLCMCGVEEYTYMGGIFVFDQTSVLTLLDGPHE